MIARVSQIARFLWCTIRLDLCHGASVDRLASYISESLLPPLLKNSIAMLSTFFLLVVVELSYESGGGSSVDGLDYSGSLGVGVGEEMPI